MCEVGAIINGRSIIKVSDYPSDSEALTANHLLFYQSENEKPQSNFNILVNNAISTYHEFNLNWFWVIAH